MTDGTKIYMCKVCGKPEGEELDGSIEPGWQTEIECGPCDDCIAWEEDERINADAEDDFDIERGGR